MMSLPREMTLWKTVGILLHALLNICPDFSHIKAKASATSLCTLKFLKVILVLPCHNSLFTFYSAFSVEYEFSIYISHTYWILFNKAPICISPSFLPLFIKLGHAAQ